MSRLREHCRFLIFYSCVLAGSLLSVLEPYFSVELYERNGVQEQKDQFGVLVIVGKRCDSVVVLRNQSDCFLLRFCVGSKRQST